MANVLTIDGPDAVRISEREKLVRYIITLSGAYVQAVRGTNTGEVLDLTKAVGANQADQYWGQRGPRRVYILNNGNGFNMQIIPGADNLHWLLRIFSASGAEQAAGAYPAGLTGDLDVICEATGRSFD